MKVAVTDDGKGLDSNLVRGFGLIGMRERVSALGGRIAFDTEEGRRPAGPGIDSIER